MIEPLEKQDPELADLFQKVCNGELEAKVLNDQVFRTKDNRVISEVVIKEEIPGRNDKCSCGSGKKYKKCCGR